MVVCVRFGRVPSASWSEPSRASPWWVCCLSCAHAHPPAQECGGWAAACSQSWGLSQPSHSYWPFRHFQCLQAHGNQTLLTWCIWKNNSLVHRKRITAGTIISLRTKSYSTSLLLSPCSERRIFTLIRAKSELIRTYICLYKNVWSNAKKGTRLTTYSLTNNIY